jgi:hypothetical protein
MGLSWLEHLKHSPFFLSTFLEASTGQFFGSRYFRQRKEEQFFFVLSFWIGFISLLTWDPYVSSILDLRAEEKENTITSFQKCISTVQLNINTCCFVYIRLKVQRDAHGFVCILYFAVFALHVSGAIYTHHQEHKLQITAVGMRNCYGTWDVG